MTNYVTDPALLEQLNSDAYVADPELLAKLNGEQADNEMPAPGDYASVQSGMSAARPMAKAAYDLTGNVRDLANVSKNVMAASPAGLKEMLQNPIQTAKAYAAGHPYIQGGLGGAARGVGGALAAPLTAPENLFTVPYTMAAYEQEKIRANPNAPGLGYNPYAQTVRGEASTQGRAGSANQMRAVANMPYGNVTPQERQMLDEDMKMKSAIRKKAFEKVMGPVAPGSF